MYVSIFDREHFKEDLPSLLIMGTARNIEPFIHPLKQSLETIIRSVPDYNLIIVESNSSDNSLSLLQNWCSQDKRRHVIGLGQLTEPERTKRIAHCRNEYMKYANQYDLFKKHAYTLIIDLDDVLQIESNFKQQLESCFERHDWDVLASNRRSKYYDIWALRSKELGITFDCWEMVNTNQMTVQDAVARFQKIIPIDHPWIKVESAFGGMVLCKSESIQYRIYNGDNGCEHVPFFKGLVMYINPKLISGSSSVHEA